MVNTTNAALALSASTDEPSSESPPREHEGSTAEALTRRRSVTEVVAIYEQAERDILDGFALIARAEKRLNDTFSEPTSRIIHVRDKYQRVNFDAPAESLTEVRRAIWWTLANWLELPRLMSIRAWKDFSEQIERGDPPEITAETVAGLARQFHGSIHEMLSEKVREVFDFLRPPGSHFKTNTEFELGKRVVLEGVIDQFSVKHLGKAGVSHWWSDRLTALESVFQSLDGQGEVTREHYSELERTIAKTPFGERGVCRYFAFRAFRRGTLHIEFLRPDLVKRLNQIAGGKRLRGENPKNRGSR